MSLPVLGVGLDVVEVSRLVTSMQRTSTFTEHVFTANEQSFCGQGPARSRHFAACFAAKEAFLKAVGRGLWNGVPLTDIELVDGELASPSLCLGPRARQALALKNASQTWVSVSQLANASMAIVLVQ
jgi:holo-[acyl-carrier protein] synthase